MPRPALTRRRPDTDRAPGRPTPLRPKPDTLTAIHDVDGRARGLPALFRRATVGAMRGVSSSSSMPRPTRSAARLALRAGVLAALLSSGCGFSDQPPDGAIILCGVDDDCPAGRRCDLPTHVCVAPGTTAALTSASFEPAITNGGVVRLVVRADKPLDPATPPRIDFVGDTSPLGLALEATEGTEQRMLVAADEAAEGLYTVARVTLTSVHGAPSIVDVVGVSLVVDRTPPIVRNARIANTPESGAFADVAPLDVIEARFLPSEPVAGAALIVGAVRSEDCARDQDGTGEMVCRLLVAEGVTDGVQGASIEATDEAGNQTSVALDPLVVDTAPPRIVPDAAVLTITEAGRSVTTASPTSDVRLDLVVSEDLGADPTVSFDVEGVRLPLAPVTRSGRRYAFRFAPPTPVPPGTWRLVASLVDRFGHGADVDVELASPFDGGVPFASAGGLCLPPPGQSCVDFDGDGHSSLFSCPDGDDPRDDDASVFPGAPELPGDGVDNNGVAGEGTIDESSGVFVDSEAGDDANDGSRLSPVQSLGRAKALRPTPSAFLYLAARATPYAFAVEADAAGTSILGGLDPTTWARTEARSVLVGDIQSPALLDSVETEGSVIGNARLVFLIRTHASSLRVFDTVFGDPIHPSAFAIDSGFGAIRSFLGRLDMIDVTANSLEAEGDVSGQRVVIRGAVSFRGASTTLVNSVVTGGLAVSGSTLNAVHCTFTSLDGPPVSIQESSAAIVGSALIATGATLVLYAEAVGLTLLGSNLYNDGGPLIRIRFENVPDIDATNSCAFTGCITAAGNISAPAGFTSEFHLGDASAMKDAAAVAGFSVPPGAAADFDRDCRFADGAPDNGADERP